MIQLFVVFHKNIYDECYLNIPDDILRNYFTFVAVNEKIPKIYTSNKYKVINEWEMPVYDKSFQERGYNENSAIYHIYANQLHRIYEYVGFFQYDMKFTSNVVDYILQNCNKQTYFSYYTNDFRFCNQTTWNELSTSNYVIRDYETFFNREFSKNEQYPLYNTYVISNETFDKIMKWVETLYMKLYPQCVSYPNKTHHGHIGGIYERIMGFAIGQERLNCKPLPIIHDAVYKQNAY